MKCPKCEYLGFETGDRCKNCGYDFSLTAAPSPRDPELMLREPEPKNSDTTRWLNDLDARLDTGRQGPAGRTPTDTLGSIGLNNDVSGAVAASSSSTTPPSTAAGAVPASAGERQTPRASVLPLFQPRSGDPDAPLVKMPAAPRAPLSVRRTPEKPRLRTVAKQVRRVEPEVDPDPVLAFADEPIAAAPPRREAQSHAANQPESRARISGPVRRVAAAMLDNLILLSIDAVVIYLTFQIAGLSASSWQSLAVLPFAFFLIMLKVAYFSVFTMVGGQTVGKMATGIRVVGDDDRDLEPARAVQRTLAALGSVATVGIGYLPVLLGGDRRTLHDRLAGTRVVIPLRSH